MFCKKCGKEISENSRFCPYCGEENEVLAKKEEKQDDPAATYRAMYNDDNEYRPIQKAPAQQESKVIPILSLIFGLLGGWLGLLFGIIGLTKCKEKGNKAMCIIGIVAWAVWLTILIIQNL